MSRGTGLPTRPRTRRGVIVNFVELGLSSVAGSVLALWATTHLARALGVEVFGQFNLARTIVDYALIPSTFGITVVAARSISSKPDTAGETAARAVFITAITGLIGLVMLAVMTPFLHDSVLKSLVWVMALVIPVQVFNIDWLYSAHETQRVPAIARTIGRTLYAVGIVFVVTSPSDVLKAAGLLVGEAALVALCLLPFGLHWLKWDRAVFDVGKMRQDLKEAFPVGLGSVSVRIKTNADLILLGILSTTLTVGYYAASYRLVLFVNSLARLYATVLLPRISRASTRTNDRSGVIRASLRLTVAVGIAVSACGGPLAGTAILVFFGPAYAPASGVLTILLVASGLIVVSTSLGHTAIAVGKATHYARYAMASAAFNVVGNLALIPLIGMYGAAVMTLLTEALVLLLLLHPIWSEGVREVFTGRWIARAIVYGAVLCGSMLLCVRVGVPFIASLAIGAIETLGLAYGFGVLSAADMRLLAAGASTLDAS